MPATRSEFFDPESLSRIQAVFDEAWGSLPSNQRTPETKAALAKTVIHLASEGETDRDRLRQRALRAIATETWHNFEVRNGDKVVATAPVFIDGPSALWRKITELANFHEPGCRIRVTDQSGGTVILVGVASALRLAEMPLPDISVPRPG